MNIKSHGFTPLEEPVRSLIGYLAVELVDYGIVLSGIRVYRAESIWVHLPSRRIDHGAFGRVEWVPHMSFADPNLQRKFEVAVEMIAIEEVLKAEKAEVDNEPF